MSTEGWFDEETPKPSNAAVSLGNARNKEQLQGQDEKWEQYHPKQNGVDFSGIHFDSNDNSNIPTFATIEFVTETIQKAVQRVEDNFQQAVYDNMKKDDAKVPDDEKYPADCYSMIALNGPGLWCTKEKPKSFVIFSFGFMVFLFQATFFSMLLFSVINERHGTTQDMGNPGTMSKHDNALIRAFEKFIPPM